MGWVIERIRERQERIEERHLQDRLRRREAELRAELARLRFPLIFWMADKVEAWKRRKNPTNGQPKG